MSEITLYRHIRVRRSGRRRRRRATRPPAPGRWEPEASFWPWIPEFTRQRKPYTLHQGDPDC